MGERELGALAGGMQTPVTSFVGRRREIGAIRRLVADRCCRGLVLLHGLIKLARSDGPGLVKKDAGVTVSN